jgi:hypothetical protein
LVHALGRDEGAPQECGCDGIPDTPALSKMIDSSQHKAAVINYFTSELPCFVGAFESRGRIAPKLIDQADATLNLELDALV